MQLSSPRPVSVFLQGGVRHLPHQARPSLTGEFAQKMPRDVHRICIILSLEITERGAGRHPLPLVYHVGGLGLVDATRAKFSDFRGIERTAVEKQLVNVSCEPV